MRRARRRRAPASRGRSRGRPGVLRVRMCSLTAISGPALRVEHACAGSPRGSACRRGSCARRGSRSTCASLVKSLSISRSRASTSRSHALGVERAPRARAPSCRRPARRGCRATTKSSPCSLNASTGPGAPGRDALGEQPHVLAGQVGVLLGARERELLLDDLLGQHEPASGRGRSCSRCSSVPRVSKPGNSGTGSRLPVASSQSDDGPGRIRMPWFGPDRVPVPDALGVVPHPVAVDEARAGRLGDAEHPAVDVGGNAGDHRARAACPSRSGQSLRTRSWLPPMPPTGDDHGLRRELEVADDLARAGRARVRRSTGREHARPRTPVTAPSRRR